MNLHLTTNPQVRKWLKVAVVDLAIVSVAQPLNFEVALLWDRGSWLFFPCFLLVVLLNLATYGISWWVSTQIMFKGHENT